MVRRYARRLVRAGSLIAAIALLCQTGTVAGQSAAQLPSAREIVDRYVEAIGGTVAFKAVSSMKALGTFKITGQAMSGSLEMMAARPSKLLTRITIAGIGPVEEGYDGK